MGDESHGNLLFSGAGGAMGGAYVVLSSTNLSLPVAQWTALETNNFDAGGGFSFSNSVIAGVQQSLYRLQIQVP